VGFLRRRRLDLRLRGARVVRRRRCTAGATLEACAIALMAACAKCRHSPRREQRPPARVTSAATSSIARSPSILPADRRLTPIAGAHRSSVAGPVEPVRLIACARQRSRRDVDHDRQLAGGG
jgi:hypothetical protein